MDRTITLRMPNTPARGDVARTTVVALAVKAGMAPLAADRAGAAVAAAVAATTADEVTIVATLGADATVVVVTGAGAGPLTYTLERTPLRQV
jgi:hypothetical protein